MDIRLRVHGRILDVGQVGNKFLILAEPCEVPPGTEAELVVAVDGRETVRRVVLHEGIDLHTSVVRFLDDPACEET